MKQGNIKEKKHRVALPDYSLGEELWNSISHGLGAIFGIFVLIFSLLRLYEQVSVDPIDLVAILIYGISLVCLYTISCIYHALARNKGKRVLRVLDHDMVFFLIAGTYTPFCLITLRDVNLGFIPHIGYFIFGLVVILTILGITMNSINIKKYEILSMILYIAIGWCIMIAVLPLYESMILKPYGLLAFILLIMGGIVYTVGSVLYGIGSKKKGMHSVFHFFVLAASVFQFLSILYGVL